MALEQRYFNPDTGLELGQAYWRVNGIVIDYISERTTFLLLIYRNHEARILGLNPIATEMVEMSGLNPISRIPPLESCYHHLKQQSRFERAKDV